MIPQKIRQKVLDRAGNLCEVCKSAGDFRGLMIHHKEMLKMGGRRGTEKERLNRLENLILVCGKCSNKYHGIKEGK